MAAYDGEREEFTHDYSYSLMMDYDYEMLYIQGIVYISAVYKCFCP